MEKIKVGVIGCGYWGPNLIRNFVEIPTSQVVAVADLREERLEHIQSRYPRIETTQDYQSLFSMDLDAVVVATPPSTHYKIARDCLEHDLSVLVEKPITLRSRDAEELIEIADTRGLTLMVGHTFEYNSAVQALKELIQSGELGEIYYIDAVRVNLGLFQTKLSVLWDLAPHDISILLYLLDRDPISVSAQGMDCLFEGVHDIAYMHLIFPGRVLANVHLSWLDPCKVRRITIIGSRKMVVFDDIEPLEKIKIYDKGVEVPPYTNTFDEFQLSYRYGDIVIPHIPFVEPLRAECNHFIESVKNHTEPQSSGTVGLKVVKVVEAATRSLENGGKQELAWPEEIQVYEHSIVSADR
jgi:predicted dehydrogenase